MSPTANTDTLPAGFAPTEEQPENSKAAEELPIHLPAEELPVQRPAEDLTATKEAQEVPEAEIVQEAPAYTPDMPVEDILKVMTLEQAQEVVVDSGVCRGLTIAEVAKKRPVNLRFYLTPGNKSKDNIVRLPPSWSSIHFRRPVDAKPWLGYEGRNDKWAHTRMNFLSASWKLSIY